jgi:two-component system CheB/CheR fusion protein
VARRTRQNSRLNHIRLVAITGFSQQEARDGSAAAGFDVHLVKPVTYDALRDVMHR